MIPPFRTTGPWQRLTGMMILAMMSGSCAVGPNYHGPPITEVPARFKNDPEQAKNWKTADPKDDVRRAAWWEIFHDPGLNRLEEEASNANQDLYVAVNRIEEARQQTRVAEADFYPNVTSSSSVNRQRTSDNLPFQRGVLRGNTSFGGSSGGSVSALSTQPRSRTYNTWTSTLDLTWELDLFGRIRRNREAAKASQQSAEADLQNTTLSVLANVAANYFNLRAIDAEIVVLQNTIKTRKDALQIAGERLQAGLTSELDVTRARSDLASNEADLATLERSRGEVENGIATLVGQPASSLRLKRDARQSTPPHIPAGLPSELLERRPDIASAERQLAASNARIGVAEAAFFPQIRLTGASGFESFTIGSLLASQSALWQIGPSVTVPVFQGFRNEANLKAARARYNESLGTYRQQVLVAFQDVENALTDIKNLANQQAAQEAAVAAAQRTLELSTQQYNKGAVTFLDVLDAERTLLTDERQNALIRGQRLQATVQLIKALGGDWSYRNPSGKGPGE